VFEGFKGAGAQEIVIDLRYNPGGYVNSCQVLTSLAGNVNRNMIFAKLKRNDGIRDFVQKQYGERLDNPQEINFYNEANSLKLNKIYVLATGDSASAAEMVINSLRGVLGDENVVHIGTTTNGKNVGMDLVEPLDDKGEKRAIDGYNYEMWPITFKVLNAKDFCNYAGGVKPDHYVNEFYDALEHDTLFDLGDPRERLLKAALTLIDGGKPSTDPAPGTRSATTRDDGTTLRPVAVPQKPGRGGAKYIPEQTPAVRANRNR
jgi:C-terminal processing protease CtpA/Prc